jgi:uncharacterized protein (TIGR02118 family)
MLKVLVVLYKRPELTWGEFRRYWKEDHGRLARQIPGLRRYVHNDALIEGKPPYGVAELWFDDQAAMDAAMSSSHGKAALNDLGNFCDEARTGIVVVPDAGVIEVLFDSTSSGDAMTSY